jgi:hypothetical protein
LIITDVIIFKPYACNFGAFKSISPPSANYLNIIKCSGVEGLNSIKKLILIIMKYSVLFEEQTKFLNITETSFGFKGLITTAEGLLITLLPCFEPMYVTCWCKDH